MNKAPCPLVTQQYKWVKTPEGTVNLHLFQGVQIFCKVKTQLNCPIDLFSVCLEQIKCLYISFFNRYTLTQVHQCYAIILYKQWNFA